MSQAATIRQPRLCLECKQIHAFRIPRFQVGQRVRLISGNGFHHQDKIGQETVIEGLNTSCLEPCDEPEYFTMLGPGSVLESRLIAIVGPTNCLVDK